MKRLLLILTIISIVNFISAQDLLVGDDFSIDNLGNTYILKNNVLNKYSNGVYECAFDNYSAGIISKFDVSNPLKILVFFGEFNKIVYLDNKLSELRSPIMLDDLGYYDVKAVCSSVFGGFWLFDNQNMCVCRIDSDLTTSMQGTNIYQKLGGANVIDMSESGNYLFLKTDDAKIIVLDKFGNYVKVVDVNAEDFSFAIENDVLYYACGNEIFVCDFNFDRRERIMEIGGGAKSFCVKHNKLFVLDSEGLKTFEIRE